MEEDASRQGQGPFGSVGASATILRSPASARRPHHARSSNAPGRARGRARPGCAAPQPDAWDDPALFDRVAIVGASASAGFGLRLQLDDVLVAALDGAQGEVLDAADEGCSCPRWGGAAAPSTRRWPSSRRSSWPSTSLSGSPTAAGRTASAAFLTQGLDQLDRFSCPVIVGGIPDMGDAVGIMLTRTQVPGEATQLALDAQVRAWAEARERVAFFDLRTGHAQTVDGEARALGVLWPPDDEDPLQGDELHPTDAGLVGLLLNALDQAGLARAVQGDAARVLARLRASNPTR